MNLDIAIWKLIPDASYHNNGDGSILWQDTRPQPSQAELEAAWVDWLNTDLKAQADEAIRAHYANQAEAFVTEAKSMRYLAKQLEIVAFDAGQRNAAYLPFMERRQMILDEVFSGGRTLQDARDDWQAAIDLGMQGLAEIEYYEELYRARLAQMVVESEQQLLDWLASLGISLQ